MDNQVVSRETLRHWLLPDHELAAAVENERGDLVTLSFVLTREAEDTLLALLGELAEQLATSAACRHFTPSTPLSALDIWGALMLTSGMPDGELAVDDDESMSSQGPHGAERAREAARREALFPRARFAALARHVYPQAVIERREVAVETDPLGAVLKSRRVGLQPALRQSAALPANADGRTHTR